METTAKIKKPPRRFKLETRQDVIHYLSETVRSLRRLVIHDKELDPIRVNKQKTLVYALSKLAEVMREEGLAGLTDEQLRAEVLRRRNLELGRDSQPSGDTPLRENGAH